MKFLAVLLHSQGVVSAMELRLGGNFIWSHLTLNLIMVTLYMPPSLAIGLDVGHISILLTKSITDNHKDRKSRVLASLNLTKALHRVSTNSLKHSSSAAVIVSLCGRISQMENNLFQFMISICLWWDYVQLSKVSFGLPVV